MGAAPPKRLPWRPPYAEGRRSSADCPTGRGANDAPRSRRLRVAGRAKWSGGYVPGRTLRPARIPTKRFQRILKRANIPKHRFHDLRHTAATLLAVQGVHPKVIQAVLGWDQLSMVDRYGHFVDEMRKQAADQMDAILNPVAVKVAVIDTHSKAN